MEIRRYWNRRWWSETFTPKAQELAAKPRSAGIVGVLEFAGLTIVPIPVALILVAFVTAAPRKWLRFALSATSGSVLASMLLYLCGHAFFHSIGERMITFYGMQGHWSGIVEKFDSNFGITFILVAGLTTGFVRIAGIAAGFAAMNPLLFFALIAISRTIRFVAECGTIKFVGQRVISLPQHAYKYAAIATGLMLLIALAILTYAT